MEVTPHFASKNVQTPGSGGGFDRSQAFTAGGDLKLGLTPNITLDATINPDFGQVEADPSVVNLTAFESFFSERRPFFVEGGSFYQFQLNCYAVVDCGTNEGLFYSRRIGRSPSLRGLHGNATTANAMGLGSRNRFADRKYEFSGRLALSHGTYSDIRELSATPEASKYADRYMPYTPPGGGTAAFKVAELRGNAVVRWEYRPGSTLFVVWQHGKESFASSVPDQSWTQDHGDLFGLQPNNTFLVKFAYWFGR